MKFISALWLNMQIWTHSCVFQQALALFSKVMNCSVFTWMWRLNRQWTVLHYRLTDRDSKHHQSHAMTGGVTCIKQLLGEAPGALFGPSSQLFLFQCQFSVRDGVLLLSTSDTVHRLVILSSLHWEVLSLLHADPWGCPLQNHWLAATCFGQG